MLDYLFIKVTDQIRKNQLWVQTLNQAGNAALQLLWTQQEIHRSLPLNKPTCQERTIVNSFWFCIQEPLLVSAATRVLTPTAEQYNQNNALRCQAAALKSLAGLFAL